MSKQMRWTAAVAALAAVCGSAMAAEPEWYVRKDTWQATMQASREALAAWEAERTAEAKEAKPARPGKHGLAMGPFHRIGPFSERGKSAFETAFAPEKEMELAGGPIDVSKRHGKLHWQRRNDADGVVHQLRCPDESALYFYRTITSKQSRKVMAYFGSDDGLVVWLNGRKIISRKVARGVSPNQDSAKLDLRKGDNHLLIKIWNRGGDCGYYFSLNEKPKGGRRGRRGRRGPTPEEARRQRLWDLVADEFASAEARRQMAWERGDNIWSRDWKPGDIADLAGRYIGPLHGTRAGETVKELAAAADTQEGLARVRQAYYAGRRVQDALARLGDINVRALRLAIEDLTASFGEKYPKGPEYLRRLDELEKLIAAAGEGKGGDEKKLVGVVEAFGALRREALLANPLLGFDKLLVLTRSAKSPKLGLPQNWQGNCALKKTGYDNEIAVLSLKDLAAGAKTLYKPEKDVFVGDVELHWDAEKMLFSSIGENGRWHVFELGADGKGLSQITNNDLPDVDNYDPVYLPDERILFASTRCFQGVPCVGGGNQVANLYLMNADREHGSVRQLTFEQDHDWCPTLLHDGRVMYTRWEYTDSPHYFTRLLFSMNPDGTQQMELYGSNSYWPNSIFYARPCPGHPTKVISVISGHHGVPRMGELILFDPAKGRHEASGVVQRIPGYGEEVEPIIRDQLVNSSWPRFLHPWPLNDKYFLVSCQTSNKESWDLFLVDVFDNMLRLYSEPGRVVFEPVPLAARARPPVIPDKVDLERDDAVIYMADVYVGDGLKDVPRGTVKKLRVFEYHYAYYRMGGHIHIGIDGPWDVHRILGTVPVKEDGSAMFRVPANRPLAFQPLDEDGQALQVMRSWSTAMPGEFLSCVGCHERQSDTAAVQYAAATARTPDEVEPWRGDPRGFSFTREVQPVLDKYCVSCHDGKKKNRAGQPIPDFRVDGTAKFRNFTPSYVALHPYVRRPGPESDYHLLPPLEYHAEVSELVQMLRKGHGGVKLDAEAWDRLITWIDLNVPDKGKWSAHRKISGNIEDRRREMRKRYANINYDPETISPTRLKLPGEVEKLPPVPDNPDAAAPGWPFDADEAKRRQRAAAESLFGADARTEMAVDLGEGLKLQLSLVPGGEFVMGDADGARDERPRCRVTIGKPFWMGRLEVTNAQYALFDSDHDSRYISHYNKDQSKRGEPAYQPEQPVIRVSWQRAMDFCRWLSDRTGMRFSLPTEAQWEWACRAGTARAFNYGPAGADFAKFANLADKQLNKLTRRDSPDWIPTIDAVSDGATITTGVGRYSPNAWNLCDMHGNVAEWTRTTYRRYPYDPGDGRDAADPAGRKVVRGGSFYDRPKRARSAFRLSYPSWQVVYNVGFRVVCEAEPGKVVAKK